MLAGKGQRHKRCRPLPSPERPGGERWSGGLASPLPRQRWPGQEGSEPCCKNSPRTMGARC